MKIGILTFPNSKSYGAALQMFALYSVCKKMGHDVEIVNYYNLWMKQEKHICHNGGNPVSVWAKKRLNGLIHLPMKMGFARFEGQMAKYPAKAVTDPKDLPEIAERYDAVICGSDQVWNPDITHYDTSFFLDFCGSGTARISYAPSFGVEELSAEFGEKVAKELKKFDFLSIREETGQKLITELTGDNAKLVVDPTLLLDGDVWQTYETAHPQATGDYILYYTVRSSASLWAQCLALAKKTNKKILRIGSNFISKQFKKTDGVEYVSDVTPDQWLYLLRNACYVVTNSFHGAAFAINFRKDFYIELSSRANSRLSGLVKLLNLEDRILTSDREVTPSQADYTEADRILDALKAESLCYLEQALKIENRKKNA